MKVETDWQEVFNRAEKESNSHLDLAIKKLFIKFDNQFRKYDQSNNELKYKSVMNELFKKWPFWENTYQSEEFEIIDGKASLENEFLNKVIALYFEKEVLFSKENFIRDFMDSEVNQAIEMVDFRNSKGVKEFLNDKYLEKDECKVALLKNLLLVLTYNYCLFGRYISAHGIGVSTFETIHFRKFLGESVTENIVAPIEKVIEFNSNTISFLIYRLIDKKLITTKDRTSIIELLQLVNSRLDNQGKASNQYDANFKISAFKDYAKAINNKSERTSLVKILREIADEFENTANP